VEALRSDNHLDDRSGCSVLDVELVHFYRCQGLYVASETARILHTNTISIEVKFLRGTYHLSVYRKHYQNPSRRAFSWVNSNKQKLVVNQYKQLSTELSLSLSLCAPTGQREIKYDAVGYNGEGRKSGPGGHHRTTTLRNYACVCVQD